MPIVNFTVDGKSRQLDIEEFKSWLASHKYSVKDGIIYKPGTSSLLKIPLYGYQKVAVEFVERAGGRAMIADEMGLGKAQPLYSKVLTPDGWRLMGELSVDDTIVTNKGNSSKIVGIYPQGVQDIYRIYFNDGSYTDCTKDHLWMVYSANHRFRKTTGIIKTTDALLNDTHYTNGNSKWFIPVTEPVQFTKNSIDIINPYMLGLMLGDGSFFGSFTFTTVDAELIDYFTDNLPDEMRIYRKKNGNRPYDWMLGWKTPRLHNTPHPMKLAIMRLGLYRKYSGEKFIPKQYLLASYENRIALLQGLVDTDGHISDDGSTIEYYTTSPKLAEDVKFLVQSLGGLVRIKSGISRYKKDGVYHTGSLSFTLRLIIPSTICPVRLNKKISRYIPRSKYGPTRAIKKIEMVGQYESQCIKIADADGLYLTDDFIVTHNTPTAIGYAMRQRLKTLVVCPKSTVPGWIREVKRFADKNAICWVSEGRLGRSDAQFHVINYDVVEKNLVELNRMKFDLLICDEATYLKNRRTKRAKAVLGSWKERKKYPGVKAKFCLFLTGTPVLNRPVEAYHLLNYIDKNRFNNFYNFIQLYGGWRGSLPQNLDDLHERTKDLVIRRTKKEVLPDLPDKQRNDLYVEMTPVDMKEYGQHLNDLFRKWRQLGKPTVAEMPGIQRFLITKKMPRAIEMIDEMLENDRGILVYSVYIDPLKALKKHYGDKASLVIGEMNSVARQKSIDDLKNGKSQVGLFSIGAGAMGIDGIQHAIDTVIFLDMWWTPGVHQQAEDRVHRIGQANKVQIFYFICENTMDEYMRQILDEKIKMIEQVVDGRIMSSANPNKSFFRDFVRKLQNSSQKAEMEDIDVEAAVEV